MAAITLPPVELAKAEALLKNYKLTPATLAFKLENLEVPPGGRLRWYPAPHLMYISLKIAMGIARGNARIIVSAPPRHGKSKLCTHYGPLWVLENFENFNVALVTYGADLSTDFSREVRDSIEDNPEYLNVRIRDDANRLARYLTNKNGSMTAIGLGGPFTGRGAHVLFIDDYIKKIGEALSPTVRDHQFEWFVSTAMTRLEPDASVVIIATRWHDDDLIGRIVSNPAMGSWEYIRLPAIAEGDDPLGREEGEALFPQRFSLKSLEERRAFMGSAFFDAIYQQDPHSEEGAFAQRSWLQYTESLPLGRMRLLRVWDFAGTADGGDYTAGGLLGHHIDTGNVYLLNMIRKQLSPQGVEKLVRETAELDSKATEIIIEQESGSSGKSLIDHYIRNVLPDFRVKGAYSNKHKLVKAQPFVAACEAGKFILLKAGWNEIFAKEFERFPDGANDDQIDTCSIGYEELMGKRSYGASWGRKKTSNTIVAPTPDEVKKIMGDQQNGARQIIPHSSAFSSMRRATFGRR